MSKPKKRNRNIQSLSSLSHINFSKFPPIDNCFPSEETSNTKEDIFGEIVEKDCYCTYKLESYPAECVSLPLHKSKLIANKINRENEDIEAESITSRVSEINLITSLSSSPSWSDENDGSKQVQYELEHMDRILRGIDPIPLHYDVDEYKQWMETFPKLSLFGQKNYGLYKIWKNDSKYDFSYNGAPKREIGFTKTKEMQNLKRYKEEMKKAVIYNIYENLSVRLNSEISSITPAFKLKNSHHERNVNRTQSYLNDCLINSPFTRIVQERYTRNCLDNRYNSPKNTVEGSPRFESLPLMFENSCKNIEQTPSKYKNDSLNTVRMKNSRRSIILPPIENNRTYPSNQIRSISATTTYSSLMSAKSMKLERKMFNGKSRNIH